MRYCEWRNQTADFTGSSQALFSSVRSRRDEGLGRRTRSHKPSTSIFWPIIVFVDLIRRAGAMYTEFFVTASTLLVSSIMHFWNLQLHSHRTKIDVGKRNGMHKIMLYDISSFDVLNS